MTDANVVRSAYITAKVLGASDKVMLALFEAGIVESGFENLTRAVDHDSLGYLQQRPSAGWPNPTNVVVATNSFVLKAKALEGQNADAGSLAQAVQQSAFPGRYSQVQGEAQSLINQTKDRPEVTAAIAKITPHDNANPLSDNGGLLNTIAAALQDVVKVPASYVAGAVNAAQDAVTSALGPLKGIGDFFAKLVDPKTWIRIGYLTLGISLLLYGLYKVGKDTGGPLGKASGRIKTVAKTAAELAILKKVPLKSGTKKAASTLVKERGVEQFARGGSRPIRAGANVAARGTIDAPIPGGGS